MSKTRKTPILLKVVGCGCAGATLAFIGLATAIVFGIFALLKNSAPYETAVETAADDLRVIEQLGTPIQTGWWVAGNLELNNNDGTADLRIPVRGPEGSGEVLIKGIKENGEWIYQRLFFQFEGQRVNLLDE